MATRKGILETQLCKDAADRAIQNILNEAGRLWLDGEAGPEDNAADIIKGGFKWHYSPEGHNYWQKIVNE